MTKEHPILFSTSMVQAILEGRKTMTRRVVKNNKLNIYIDDFSFGKTAFTPENHVSVRGKWIDENKEERYGESFIKYPFGSKGDKLWVKELHYRYGKWNKNGTTKTGKQKWIFKPDNFFTAVMYFDLQPAVIEKNSYRKTGWYKRNSLFMPKEACRVFLEITNIKVERLQEISEEDAIKEGIRTGLTEGYRMTYDYMRKEFVLYDPIGSYKSLWQSIHGEGSWQKNEWVWVIEFFLLPNDIQNNGASPMSMP